MSWIPENTDFLTIFGAVVAVLASLTAAGAGLYQVTLRPRMMRRLEWVRSALDDEDDPARKKVLKDIRLGAEGQLVAAHHVAYWRLLETILWVTLAPVSLFLASRGESSLLGLGIAVLTGVATISMPLRRGIRLYSERARVVYQYMHGVEIGKVRTDLLEQMEGGTRREFRMAYVGAAVFEAIGAVGAWIVANPNSYVAWLSGVVVLALLHFWSDDVRQYAKKMARNPPKQAAELVSE